MTILTFHYEPLLSTILQGTVSHFIGYLFTQTANFPASSNRLGLIEIAFTEILFLQVGVFPQKIEDENCVQYKRTHALVELKK